VRQAAQPIRSASGATRRRNAARGITLLELLVVMLILLMVTAAAIPIIAPAMQNRQMRESTRLVTSFMGAAKARAVQTGRPVGVMIERFNGQPFALQMSQVEVPPPYSGDIVGARLTVTALPSASVSTNAQANFTTLFPGKTAEWFKGVELVTGMLNTRLIKVGDQIQLNGQGPHYVILGPDPNFNGALGDITTTTPLEIAYIYTPPLKQAFPWLNTTPAPQPATYQITRQPVRTNSPPLQLPEGIVVDLTISGVGSGKYDCLVNYGAMTIGTTPTPLPSVRFDPLIVFSPSGRVELASNNFGLVTRVTDPIYLLLGRRELMADVTTKNNDSDIVFQNLSAVPPAATPGDRMPPTQNFWITIGPTSGQVSVSEVAPHMQDYKNVAGHSLSNYDDLIKLALWGTNPAGTVVGTGARTYAKESQSLGGR
jgi:type II secretory pathway pseudopilin PulG